MRIVLALLVAMAWFAPKSAARQTDTPESGSSSGEITIKCPWFGVGGVVRAGEWAGLQLTVNDSSDRQREVLIRIAMTDPDGDRTQFERTLTTNPGVSQPLWMYIRLPSRFKQGEILTVNAYEALERPGGGAAAERWAYEAGRQLGTARITPRAVLRSGDGILGIAGARFLGLMKYAGVPGRSELPTGHERTEVVSRLDAESLPDRWMGLAQFDVIVWNEPPPGTLTSDRAQALREWVQRGGHLVVVLPRVAQTWTDETNNPLYDITPRVRVTRREGVDLAPYRNLITKSRDEVPMPSAEVLQTFTPLDGAERQEAMPVLSGVEQESPTGPIRETLAVRRIVGVGMVTLVGLDVASRWMTERALPDPEAFWHRILGRRGELWTPSEYQASQSKLRIASPDIPTTVDRDIAGDIAMTGFAATGVFMGFVVFIAYWLVAGPLGYAVLRRSGQVRHAWLAFVAAAGLFTALAWGGATAIRPGQLKAQQFTIIDHVYGQGIQRARVWSSLLIPQYGEATVSVGDPATKAGSQFHNSIVPWETESSTTGGFPDARGYVIDSKSPDQITVPTRSTVKQFQIDWLGASRLKMPAPQPIPGKEGLPGLEIAQESARPVLHGILSHDLPGELSDVTIFVVKAQKEVNRSLLRSERGPLLADIFAARLSNPWPAGAPLDLSTAIGPLVQVGSVDGDLRSGEKFFQQITRDLGRTDQVEGVSDDGARFWNRLLAVTFFHQLEPPEILPENRQATFGNSRRWAQRKVAHGYDLSAWITQPCVVVVGQLTTESVGPAPVPLFVSTGGSFREVKAAGRTVVRWIYPLSPAPPLFTSPSREPETAPPAEGANGGPL